MTLHLRDASLMQENAHARLLPHVKMRWSADQAAIIYSIWLYDTNNGTTYADEPLQRWLAYMHENATHPETGLFITEVMGTKKYSEQPRGCSAAYMIYYMSYFAPELAQSQWALFKEHMGISMLGLRGFREYLAEFDGEWTPDSGPIIAEWVLRRPGCPENGGSFGGSRDFRRNSSSNCDGNNHAGNS